MSKVEELQPFTEQVALRGLVLRMAQILSALMHRIIRVQDYINDDGNTELVVLLGEFDAPGTDRSHELEREVALVAEIEFEQTRVILGRIMALAPCSAAQVSCLGIDDCSFRRGRRFGTILVDLTTHKILDLLPERDAETAAAWMRKHPEIEVVSRDRGEEYAAAARLGAPQATQCADRFHLAQNLTKIVEDFLARCRGEFRKALKTETSMLTQWPAAGPPPAGSAHLARHAEQTNRYHQLLDLRKAGLILKEIARRLGMGERTVR